jgi:hypothetical protein
MFSILISASLKTAFLFQSSDGHWVMGRTSRWDAAVGPLRVHLTLEGDLYNITKYTRFTGAGTIFGSASFGTVSSQVDSSRRRLVVATVRIPTRGSVRQRQQTGA